jgi:hypothetical protein
MAGPNEHAQLVGPNQELGLALFVASPSSFGEVGACQESPFASVGGHAHIRLPPITP